MTTPLPIEMIYITLPHDFFEPSLIEKREAKLKRILEKCDLTEYKTVILDEDAQNTLSKYKIPDIWYHDFSSKITKENEKSLVFSFYIIKYDDDTQSVNIIVDSDDDTEEQNQIPYIG